MATILVTGASSGIGAASARRLLEDGNRVYVAARRVDRMQDVVGLGAIALAMDITKDADIEAAVARITDEAGGVDVLVNNAGFGLYGSVEETSLDDARYQFEVNLFGLARLTQLVLPGMRARGGGRIINMSSMGGKVYTPLGAWYHATKHALEGWSDCLRFELAPHGIEVVIIEPGAISTEFGEVLSGPMMERSGSGPYAAIAKGVAKMMQSSYERQGGSPPTVIAELISDAVAARRPKTRYVAGKYARPMMAIRKWGGDRVYDRLMARMV